MLSGWNSEWGRMENSTVAPSSCRRAIGLLGKARASLWTMIPGQKRVIQQQRGWTYPSKMLRTTKLEENFVAKQCQDDVEGILGKKRERTR